MEQQKKPPRKRARVESTATTTAAAATATNEVISDCFVDIASSFPPSSDPASILGIINVCHRRVEDDPCGLLVDYEACSSIQRALEGSPSLWCEQSVVKAFQSFTSRFVHTFETVESCSEIGHLIRWLVVFAEFRVHKSPALHPTCLKFLLDAVRRYLTSTVYEPITKRRAAAGASAESAKGRGHSHQHQHQPPPTKIASPLSAEGWGEIQKLLEVLRMAVEGRSIGRSELMPLLHLLCTLYLLNEDEIDDCGTNGANSTQILAVEGLLQAVRSSLVSLDDIIELVVERVVLHELPSTSSSGTRTTGGSNCKFVAADGTKVHRVTALLSGLMVASVSSVRRAAPTSVDLPRAERRSLQSVLQLGTWPGPPSLSPISNELWRLSDLKTWGHNMKKKANDLCDQLFAIMLPQIAGSNIHTSVGEAQTFFKKRSSMVRTYLWDLAQSASSPYHPINHHLILAALDTLARLSYHEQPKSLLIQTQCYTELARESYAIASNLQDTLKTQQIPHLRANPSTCYCGATQNLKVHSLKCQTCGQFAHLTCIPRQEASSRWICILCQLILNGRLAGQLILNDFASRFWDKRPRLGTLLRRLSTDTTPTPLEVFGANTFPEEAVRREWWFLVNLLSLLPTTLTREAILAIMTNTLPNVPPPDQDQDQSQRQPVQGQEQPQPPPERPTRATRKRRRPEDEESQQTVVKRERRESQVAEAMVKTEIVEAAIDADDRGVFVPIEKVADDLLRYSIICYHAGCDISALIVLPPHRASQIWLTCLDLPGSDLSVKLEVAKKRFMNIVLAKLFSTLTAATHSSQARLAETLVHSLTDMMISVKGSPLKEIRVELKNLYEEFLSGPKAGPLVKRALINSLHKFLQKEALLIFHPDRDKTSVTVPSSLFPFIPANDGGPGPDWPQLHTESEIGTQSPITQEEWRRFVEFVNWTTRVCLARAVQRSSITVRAAAWRLISLSMYCLPFEKSTRGLLERILININNEDSGAVRDSNLHTLRMLTVSESSQAFVDDLKEMMPAPEWQASDTVPSLDESDLLPPPSTTDAADSASGTAMTAASGTAASEWPLLYQYCHIIVSLALLAEKHEVTVIQDDGTELSLLGALVGSHGKEVSSDNVKELIGLLITFFAFCKNVPNTRRCQRYALKMIQAFQQAAPPGAILQVVPFALPYVASVPANAAAGQLTAEICDLLGKVLENSPGVLGTAQGVRKRLQPEILRLTRVRGICGHSAVCLMCKILSSVTGDYATILPLLISKDVCILTRSLHQNAQALAVIAPDTSPKSKIRVIKCLLDSPLFVDRNTEVLKHGLLRLGGVLESLDLPSVIGDGNDRQLESISESSPSSSAPIKTPIRGDAASRHLGKPLPVELVSEWMTPEPGVSLMPLPSNGTHALIAIYDMLCDIFLEIRELREHTDALDQPPVDLTEHISALEIRLGPHLLDCITSIIGRHHDLVSSSRLARMLEFALDRARSDQVRIAGLSLMVSAVKVPPDSALSATTSLAASITPAGVKSTTSIMMSGTGTRQSRAQVTQPLVQHLPAVAAGLLHLHSVPPLILTNITNVVATEKATHGAVALKSLEFLSEVIAQGLVSVSDLFEYVSPAFVLGSWQVETKARLLASRVLSSTKDPAAVIRRKMGLACFCGFVVYSKRYEALSASTVGGGEWSSGDIDHLAVFRTLGLWYEEFARRKVALRSAFLESIVSSWNKLINLTEVSTLVSNLIEDRSRIIDFRRTQTHSRTFDLLLFVASYSVYLSSLIMALPYGHLGEVQEVIIAVDSVLAPLRTYLRCEDIGEWKDDDGDGEQGVESGVEEDMKGTDWNLQFKKLSLAVLGAAGCCLKRDLMRAFKIADLQELQKKKLTNKEGEGKQFHYDGGDSGGSGYVRSEDRCFSASDFLGHIDPILSAVNEDFLASEDCGNAAELDAIIKAQVLPLLRSDHYREVTTRNPTSSSTNNNRQPRAKSKPRAAARRRQRKDTDNEEEDSEEEEYMSDKTSSADMAE